MSAEPARAAALRALLAVTAGHDLERALDRARRELPAGGDPSFVVELVKGALQWQGRYDHLVEVFSRRRAPADARVRAVLRLSLHQVLGLGGVPAHAALHQAGELCRAAARPAAAGYVNAVLRAVQRAAAGADEPLAALRARFPDPARRPVDHLAAWHSLPRWLVARWHARLGDAACAALCAQVNRPAPVCLHVLAPHDPAIAAATLAAAGAAVAPGRWHPRALVLGARVPRPVLRAWLEAQPGLIVQDEGAQAATRWLAADLRAPATDLCAAPGGKAVHLASLLAPGERLLALDLRPRRLRRLRDTLARLGEGRVLVAAGDARQAPLRPHAQAAVLLDGPCSGTGVLRHHPEGRWRLREATVVAAAARLRELALAAADLLAPGGCLYYATCSLEHEENEGVVDAVLAARPELEPAPAPDGAWRRTWWPHETGTDGFFAARLRRSNSGETTS